LSMPPAAQRPGDSFRTRAVAASTAARC
jgi:hypothetical protein